MTQDFSILGMTCQGCVTQVSDYLNSLEDTESVKVDLKGKKATISSDRLLTLGEIQAKLPQKYTITTFETPSKAMENEFSPTSKWRQLRPLFLVFGYLIAGTVLMNYTAWNLSEAMLDFMGLFYMVFSFFKLLDVKGFVQSFRRYDPLAMRLPVYAWVYPFMELILGLFFLTHFQLAIALWMTVIILGITTVGVSKVLLDKKAIRCACLGTTMKLPMTEATFIENAIMLVMAFVMLLDLY